MRIIYAFDVHYSGEAQGEILKLDQPLSFWGGFNPIDGSILDQNHPQVGQSVNGKILVLPGTRGSAGTPGAVAEALRSGVGPAAILLIKPDVNILTGVLVAAQLYQITTPMLILEQDDFELLTTGYSVEISDNKVSLLISD